jgi:CubicO group peptidase (beta-lactamase class C family)
MDMFSTNDLSSSIQHYIDNAYPQSEPGAGIILLRNGQILYRGGVGLANLEHQIPIDADMPFRLASLTKPLTATAILLLEEQGQLKLTDPITRFLPDFPTGKTPITLEHLVTHTSGIQNYTQLPEWWAVHRQDLNPSELIDLFQSHPKVFPPGTHWTYSNSGYVLLGAIIEEISGQSYGEFIEQQIFAPLEMQHSWYGGNVSQVIPKLVSGYSKPAAEYVHAEYLSYTQAYAAGGLVSTVDDLAKWFSALCTGKLLSADIVKRAWEPYHLQDGEPVSYGYGWMLSAYNSHSMIEHNGLLPGFSTYLIGLPEEAIFAAVLSNNDSQSTRPERLAFELVTLALGQPYKTPDSIELPQRQASQYTGQYQSPYGETLTVIQEEDDLFLVNTNAQKVMLHPSSPHTFFTPDQPGAQVSFSFAAGQQASVLTWAPRQLPAIQAMKIT